ncbi:unnamed protein product [Ectocarpus sp. CCAP 1310/34]|nr:unnamed protein product [Ectocarpus sp. CCAP 1310/34]
MDVDGTCLVVSPCNNCRINKNGVQACIMRKHNARLTAVKRDELAARHRQCVKPDQTMTIFKLVDRNTGEESVEYSPDMIFQRPCASCIHLKTCILGRHELTDWTPEGGRGRTSQNKRKSASTLEKALELLSPPAGEQQQQQQPLSKTRKVTDGYPKPSITIPGPALKAARKSEGATTATEELGRSKRWSSKGRRVSAPEAFEEAVPSPAAAAPPEDEVCAAADAADTDEDVDVNDHACVSNGAVAASASGGSGSGSAPQQSIASQLDALAAQEDLLLQQFRADMRHLDEAKASRETEIRVAQAALDKIKATRETTKSNTAEQRKRMVAERDRLTHLRCQEMMREEAEHRQKKDDLWSAVEPAMSTATLPAEEASGCSFGGGSTATEGSESGAQPGDGPPGVSSPPGGEEEGRSAALLLASSSADAAQGGPGGGEALAGRGGASVHEEASDGNAEEAPGSSAGSVVAEAGGDGSALVSCSVEETAAASSPGESETGSSSLGKGSAARNESRDSASLDASATQGTSAVVEIGATQANSVGAGAAVASALTVEEGLGSGSDGASLPPAGEDEDEANSSMEVDDNEEEEEEEEEGEGEGGSSSHLQDGDARTGGGEANGGGVANGKAASTGVSGRATRQVTRHGGLVSEA